uniref:Histone RNA hairpin-binding protein RNA-binding domain-containing protein n=1 Tax=Anopheles epiroticus TaxID=199890 RepID=A0A182PPZ8_9DIPT
MSSTSVDFSCKIDLSRSWYEPTPEELEEEARMMRSAREQLPESTEAASVNEQTTDGERNQSSSADDSDEMSIPYKAPNGGRQIEIDILDSANVKKFEKLVQNDLIKSPFKRRLSGESSSEEAEEFRSGRKMDHCGTDDNEAGAQRVGDDGNTGNGQWKKSKKHENDHGSSWRLRRESSSSGASSQNSRRQVEYETDEAVLARRQKQIDYGKNTLGYENYIQQVPRHARTKDHPMTPQKTLKYSRRAWDGLVRVWRKKLHCFDPDGDTST